ncbi:acyl-CoA N-acyltransferase [Fistulina hepatica ATCC 64428]|uniref:Acyl-CoA N-acyltransferase n=1 Tax=Fistulina hepatica ATCC 64428 TaxID=1128425 RepID=A0A0D7AF15_9AGAR|nr:acyl-CoA N-acyltransferase [Fistulina hepatica ATCC 64428]
MSGRPTITISLVELEDLPAISKIQVLALDSNPIDLRIAPLDVRAPLEVRVRHVMYARRKQLLHPRPDAVMLKAVISSPEIESTPAGFAVWMTPVDRTATSGEFTAEEKQQMDSIPEEMIDKEIEDEICRHTDQGFVKEFRIKLAERRKAHFGGNPFWYLQMLVVHPSYQRMGVGRELMSSGLSRADESSLPTYVEATMRGLPVYEKTGFRVVGHVEFGGDIDKFLMPVMIRNPKRL